MSTRTTTASVRTRDGHPARSTSSSSFRCYVTYVRVLKASRCGMHLSLASFPWVCMRHVHKIHIDLVASFVSYVPTNSCYGRSTMTGVACIVCVLLFEMPTIYFTCFYFCVKYLWNLMVSSETWFNISEIFFTTWRDMFVEHF